MPTIIENSMQQIYDRFFDAAEILSVKEPLIRDLGFRLLCGPPLIGAPMLISTNPGASDETIGIDRHTFWEKTWPSEMSYARQQRASEFSRRLSLLFSEADIQISEMNAGYTLMFRSKSISEWDSSLDKKNRGFANDLCSQTLREIVGLLRPKLIYAAGFETFKRLGCEDEEPEKGWGETSSGDKRRIAKYGSYRGVRVISTLHPSGSQYSTENRSQMAMELRQFWNDHENDRTRDFEPNGMFEDKFGNTPESQIGEKSSKLDVVKSSSLTKIKRNEEMDGELPLDEITEACIRTVLWVARKKEETEGVDIEDFLEVFTTSLLERSKIVAG
jgi:hypothetical protein